MREAAVYVLGQLGSDAKAAIPALKNLVESKDPLAQTAAEALEKINPGKPRPQEASNPAGR